MPKIIDGQALFQKYSQQEPIPDVALDLTSYICKHIGEVLVSVLDKPLTLASYGEAKLIYCKWMLEDPQFNEKFGEMLDDLTWGMWRNLYADLISQLQVIVDNPEAFQKKTGMTEEVMIGKFSLNSEAQSLYEDQELTIGSLLMSQPKIILDNTGG